MTKIYIGTWGHYNNGSLKGEWLELPVPDMQAELDRIFGEGEHEYFIQDEEADFTISEDENLKQLNEFVEAYDKLDEYDQKKCCFLLENNNSYSNKKEALDDLDDVTFYPGQTLKDVAYELVDEGCFGKIPESIVNYIDYEAIARDLSMDGYVELSDGVYRN